MSVPQIYDMLIDPIRGADAQSRFLYSYLLGPQTIFETLVGKIQAIPSLVDPRDCPDDLLQYLKDSVGFDRTLDHITRDLTDAELRRLITIASELWRVRGTEAGLRSIFRAFTGKSILIYTWFDMIFIMDENLLDYYEPFLVGDPGDLSLSEYRSYLFVMDEGDLNHPLARGVANLARPFSERIRIGYLDFLDDFLLGLGFWSEAAASTAPADIEDGMMHCPLLGNSIYYVASQRSADWEGYYAEIVFKFTSTWPSGKLGFMFYREAADTKYVLYYDEDGVSGKPGLILQRFKPGNNGQVAAVEIPRLYNATKYSLAVYTFELPSGDLRIKAYLDHNPYIEVDDSGSRPVKGSVGIDVEDGTEAWFDDVILFEHPLEYDEVGP